MINAPPDIAGVFHFPSPGTTMNTRKPPIEEAKQS